MIRLLLKQLAPPTPTWCGARNWVLYFILAPTLKRSIFYFHSNIANKFGLGRTIYFLSLCYRFVAVYCDFDCERQKRGNKNCADTDVLMPPFKGVSVEMANRSAFGTNLTEWSGDNVFQMIVSNKRLLTAKYGENWIVSCWRIVCVIKRSVSFAWTKCILRMMISTYSH